MTDRKLQEKLDLQRESRRRKHEEMLRRLRQKYYDNSSKKALADLMKKAGYEIEDPFSAKSQEES